VAVHAYIKHGCMHLCMPCSIYLPVFHSNVAEYCMQYMHMLPTVTVPVHPMQHAQAKLVCVVVPLVQIQDANKLEPQWTFHARPLYNLLKSTIEK
jgi:hypothetical protein